MNWLDRFPTVWLVALAVWMAVAPVTPEPHLVEKLKMLFAGTLTRPLDIFDLAGVHEGEHPVVLVDPGAGPFAGQQLLEHRAHDFFRSNIDQF